MTELFFILLHILFPLDPVRRMKEAVRGYLEFLAQSVAGETNIHDLLTKSSERIDLEIGVTAAEAHIRALIERRAGQILHLPIFPHRRTIAPRPRRASDLETLLRRLERAIALFNNIERLAQRRATRIKRERTENPLGISPSFTPIAPALLRLCSLSAQAGSPRRSVAKAGGGSRARAPP